MAVKLFFLLSIIVDTTQILKNFKIIVKPIIKCSHADLIDPYSQLILLTEAVILGKEFFPELIPTVQACQTPGWQAICLVYLTCLRCR